MRSYAFPNRPNSPYGMLFGEMCRNTAYRGDSGTPADIPDLPPPPDFNIPGFGPGGRTDLSDFTDEWTEDQFDDFMNEVQETFTECYIDDILASGAGEDFFDIDGNPITLAPEYLRHVLTDHNDHSHGAVNMLKLDSFMGALEEEESVEGADLGLFIAPATSHSAASAGVASELAASLYLAMTTTATDEGFTAHQGFPQESADRLNALAKRYSFSPSAVAALRGVATTPEAMIVQENTDFFTKFSGSDRAYERVTDTQGVNLTPSLTHIADISSRSVENGVFNGRISHTLKSVPDPRGRGDSHLLTITDNHTGREIVSAPVHSPPVSDPTMADIVNVMSEMERDTHTMSARELGVTPLQLHIMRQRSKSVMDGFRKIISDSDIFSQRFDPDRSFQVV